MKSSISLVSSINAILLVLIFVLPTNARSGAIRGVVSFERQPVSDALVSLYLRTPSGSSYVSSYVSKTNSKGEYRLDSLPVGDYIVIVSKGDTRIYQGIVKIDSRVSKDIVVDRVPSPEPTPVGRTTIRETHRTLGSTSLDLLHASQRVRSNPHLRLNLLLHAISSAYSDQSIPNHELQLALGSAMWKDTWWPSYMPGGGKKIGGVDVSPSGNLLAIGCTDGTVEVWTIEPAARLHTIKAHEKDLASVNFSHHGDLLATADVNGNVKVWNLTSRADLRLQFHTPLYLKTVQFSPDDSLVITVDVNDQIVAWSASTGIKSYQLRVPIKGAVTMAFVPEKNILATGHNDGTIWLWDIRTGREQKLWQGRGDPVFRLSVSPDGRQFLVSEEDQFHPTVRSKWVDAETRKVLGSYSGEDKGLTIEDGVITAGHRVILVGSSSGEMRVWDAISRQDLLVLPGHGGWRAKSKIIRNPMTLILWDKNAVRIVPVEFEQIVGEARKRATPMSSEECKQYMNSTPCPDLKFP